MTDQERLRQAFSRHIGEEVLWEDGAPYALHADGRKEWMAMRWRSRCNSSVRAEGCWADLTRRR